ncbi:DsrE/DsrF/DrsH-like family protein [Thiomicrospira sp. WB1]|uniref:DsrE/DsrF/DrsH-like family protein n=1 Tax=Thiomicrospira sp. WB1 TaxID=1685380 RepID=UPI00074724AF|nr:DsrE/DsrF/DrsH-like family protein [Thiomicrospira sp. WB1]KUJ72852.1 NADH dehydrogenase [Thiomicrospira sp. WB1]
MPTDAPQADVSLIQSKGTLDWAYPPMILASTAAAMDKEVEIFFTFYGIECLRKDTTKLKVSPVGNPAMPLKLPYGPKALQSINWRFLPDAIWSLPGMTSLATRMFHQTLAHHNQLPFDQLRTLCLDMGVRFTVCQMSMDLLGYQTDDLIDGLDFAGAATYFARSPQEQSLFI